HCLFSSGLKDNIEYNRAMSGNKRTPRKTSIAVIAFDGITPFHLSVPSLIFGNAVDASGRSLFRLQVCAVKPGCLPTSAGFAITIDHGLAALKTADIVVMPSWYEDCRLAPTALLDALRAVHKRGARVVGLCLGSFPLAQAGLLNGKTATTQWQAADQLAERFPSVKVDRDVLYVAHDDIVT